MRKLLTVIGVLIILLMLIVVIVPFFVDLNTYKAQYLPIVEEALNRKVTLQNIRLTILPRIGVHITGVSVMDDPLFSTGPFASVGGLDLGLKLGPLIRGRVEVDEIIIREPTIVVIKNSLGLLNVSTIGKQGPAKAPEPPGPEAAKGPLHALTLLAVDKLALTDGQVTYSDRSSGKSADYVLQKLQFKLQGVGLGLTPVLHATTTIQPFNLPLKVDGSLGPLQETLDVTAFVFDIALGKSVFEIKGSTIGGETHFALSSPSIVSTNLPMTLPLTKPVELKNLHLTGEVKDSQVNVGSLEALLPLGKNAVTIKGSSIGGETKVRITAPVINTADLPIAFPLKKPLDVTDLQATAVRTDAHLRVDALSFNLVGGQVKGQAETTTGKNPLPFSTKASVQGIQLGQVMDAIGTDRVSVTGTAASDLSLQGKGFSVPELTNSLEGTGRLTVKDGKIEGINLLKEATALLQAIGVSQNLGDATVFSTVDSNFTIQPGIVKVERLLMDSRDFQAVGNGTVGFDKRLNMHVTLNLSEALSKSLGGSSPLVKSTMTKGRISIPMIITGNTQAPAFALDSKAIGSKVGEQVKERLGEALKGKEGEDVIKKGEETLKKLFGR
jgi:AsmA protein